MYYTHIFVSLVGMINTLSGFMVHHMTMCVYTQWLIDDALYHSYTQTYPTLSFCCRSLLFLFPHFYLLSWHLTKLKHHNPWIKMPVSLLLPLLDHKYNLPLLENVLDLRTFMSVCKVVIYYLQEWKLRKKKMHLFYCLS